LRGYLLDAQRSQVVGLLFFFLSRLSHGWWRFAVFLFDEEPAILSGGIGLKFTPSCLFLLPLRTFR